MILTFTLSRYRLAKVWLDEAPRISFSASSTEMRRLRPTVRLETSHRITAAELYIPQGPKASYALLGAELIGSDSQEFEVLASVASGGTRYSDSLASKRDEVYVGLPNEYVGSVFKGVERTAKTIGAPMKGALHFKWAAYGYLDSSPWIFEKVSGLVLQLLVLPHGAMEQEIKTALEGL